MVNDSIAFFNKNTSAKVSGQLLTDFFAAAQSR